MTWFDFELKGDCFVVLMFLCVRGLRFFFNLEVIRLRIFPSAI